MAGSFVVPRDLPAMIDLRKSDAMPLHEKNLEFRKRFAERKNFGYDIKRSDAIAKWPDLVLMHPEESTLGTLLLAEVSNETDFSAAVKLLTDCWAKKSTPTLQPRAGSFAAFVSSARRTSTS